MVMLFTSTRIGAAIFAFSFLAAASQAHAFGGKRSSPVEYKGKISFAEDVPEEQVRTLRNDLAILDGIQLREVDSEMLRIMHLSGHLPGHLTGTTGTDLRTWLEDRVQYLVAENTDLKGIAYVATSGYIYDNPSLFPAIEPSGKIPARDAKIVPAMANVGVGLYQGAKQTEILIGLNVPGLGKIEMTSPRVGVIQIIATPGHSMDRLGTLFHEARHSDGNGRSLGFPHAVCPAGSDYAGYYACDRNLNGPYSVGGHVLAAFARSCDTCSVEEKEMLKLRALDSFSRVIKITQVADVMAAEDVERKLAIDVARAELTICQQENKQTPEVCAPLEAKLQALSSSAGQAAHLQEVASTDWNDLPEGRR